MARKSSKNKEIEIEISKDNYIVQWVITLLLVALAVITVGQMGLVGQFLTNVFRVIFGNFYYVFVVLLAILALLKMIFRNKAKVISFKTILAFILILAVIEIASCFGYGKENIGYEVFNLFRDQLGEIYRGEIENAYGGFIGVFLYSLLTQLVDYVGTIFVVIILILISLLLLLTTSWGKMAIDCIKNFFTLPSQLVHFEDDEQLEEDEMNKPLNVKVETKQVRYLIDEIEEKPLENTQQFNATTKNSIFIDSNETISDTRDNLDILSKTSQQPVVKKNSLFIDDDPIENHNDIQENKVEKGSYLNTISLDDHIDENVDINIIETNSTSELNYVPRHSNDLSFYQNSNNNDNHAEVTEENEPVIVEQTKQVSHDMQIKNDQPVVENLSTRARIAMLANEKRKEDKKETVVAPTSGPYKIVPLTLLDNPVKQVKNNINEQAASEKGKKLIEVLDRFGIEASLIATHIGPAVTKFEVKPDANVKVSRISNLSDNIKMELQAKTLRIEAPIPGHNAVGVEIPNAQSSMVKMKEVIGDTSVTSDKSPLLFALGKNLMGEPVTCRLDKMPHLLIAGATGSGKSVCMNSIITSILLRTNPDDVKLLLIDPKKVEFTPYHGIPHLIGPVVNDANKANNALKVIVNEMDSRYDLFSLAGVRKISDYNDYAQSHHYEKLPYIVVIIDELADLMNVAGKEVETSIQRITQLARAAGIHLIVATQRPSTDVITGVIKANIPSRIAFSVSSSIDSRTILDHAGAEKLLGNGDMLYIPMGEQIPQRVQGVYVSDSEVEAICDYAKSQRSPKYADEFVQLDAIDNGEDVGGLSSVEADPVYSEARSYVISTQKASTSLLQRRFSIGYNRAARIIDALENDGVIGPAKGSKPREVFVKSEEEL